MRASGEDTAVFSYFFAPLGETAMHSKVPFVLSVYSNNQIDVHNSLYLYGLISSNVLYLSGQPDQTSHVLSACICILIPVIN